MSCFPKYNREEIIRYLFDACRIVKDNSVEEIACYSGSCAESDRLVYPLDVQDWVNKKR